MAVFGPTRLKVEGVFPVSPRRFLLLLVVLVAGISFAPRQVAAQQADVIRGRVIGPDSLPLPEVLVTVTSFSGNVSRTARTNRDGRFTVTFPSGDGDYMVAFAAIGYAAKRFEVKRMADEEILVADAKLTKVDAVLGNMTITAPRDKVARNDPTPDISGTERPIPTQDVPANLMGDLAAMAATLPGVQTVPGEGGDPNGFSVLGLGADQNNTTLNGMNFGGSGLPRDAAVSSSLVTTPYDVSRGGFSGAQFSIRTRPGSNFITRGMSLNLDAPQMQWTDAAARALGQEYTNVSLGGAISGPITFDKAFYNVVVSARAPRERLSEPARHGSRRAPGGRCVVGLGRAAAQHPRNPVGAVDGRRGLERPAERPGLAVRQHRFRSAGVDARAAPTTSRSTADGTSSGRCSAR